MSGRSLFASFQIAKEGAGGVVLYTDLFPLTHRTREAVTLGGEIWVLLSRSIFRMVYRLSLSRFPSLETQLSCYPDMFHATYIKRATETERIELQ